MVDCWTCGAERGRASFCPTCGKVQPVVPKTNRFELLGLEAKMSLNRSELESAFLKLSRSVHPDRFENALERRIALEQTTALNEAHRTLRDPMTRAAYLLELRGVTVGHEADRVDDPEFLMEMLELREALEHAKSRGDIQPLIDDVESRRKALFERIEAFFDRGQGEIGEAKKGVEELRFLERFLDELEAKFDEV